MRYLKYTIFIMTAMILFLSSCVSTKSIENCEIEKVITVTAKSDNSYFMQVRFNRCTSKELRENLIKEEIRNRFPLLHDKTIYVKEYYGKLYNEYRYGITVE